MDILGERKFVEIPGDRKGENMETEMMVKVVAGALAVLCLVAIVLRRKGKKTSSTEDDF